MKQSLEFMQDQIFVDDINDMKKKLKKLDKKIKEVDSSKLSVLEDR